MPENFDLVLEFNSELSRDHFIHWIDEFFTKPNTQESKSTENDDGKCMEKNESSLITVSSDDTILGQGTSNAKRKLKLISYPTKFEILKKAETKERRQEKLDHFFREAYALTFGIK